MKNEMTTTLTERQIEREEIARLSALSDAELIRWVRLLGTFMAVPTAPCTKSQRAGLIERIRLSNRLVENGDGGYIWVDADEDI